jgi:hypothetical protein
VSALRYVLDVTVDGRDEPVRVVADGREIRAWEARDQVSALHTELSLSVLTWMAWRAGQRTGALAEWPTWEAFDAVCSGVAIGEEPGPTPAPDTPGAR